MQTGIDIQTQLSALADLGATWVMWLLVGLSAVCLSVVLERAHYFWHSRASLASLQRDLDEALRAEADERGRLRLAASAAQEARVLSAALDASRHGLDGLEERLASAVELTRLDMERRLSVLGTIGSNAPFVGLLGTVIGIIGAFREMERAAGQVTAGLMAEIGEALIATAVGLFVALPAVVFFNLFSRVCRTRLSRADALGKTLLAGLKTTRPAQPVE